MTLTEFIRSYGTTKLANKMGVRRSTVNYWAVYHCLPKPEYMRELIKISKHELTYDVIIEAYLKKNNL